MGLIPLMERRGKFHTSPSSSLAQDTALSRRRHRFKSGRGRQFKKGHFSSERWPFFFGSSQKILRYLSFRPERVLFPQAASIFGFACAAYGSAQRLDFLDRRKKSHFPKRKPTISRPEFLDGNYLTDSLILSPIFSILSPVFSAALSISFPLRSIGPSFLQPDIPATRMPNTNVAIIILRMLIMCNLLLSFFLRLVRALF